MGSYVLTAGVPLVGTSWVDYVYIPLVSGAVVLMLALVLRWSMHGSRSSRGRGRGSRVADERQGLLIGVASTNAADAERIRVRLVAAGLHATSRPVAARTQVLVWPDDVDRALEIVAAERRRPR